MSVVWRAGRLSQQLLIDLALLVESNNLRFITTHQPQFRADLYNHVQDHVFLDDADDQPLRLGAKVILPSTHKGSARYMQQRFQDAMAVVVRLGRPSLFLTMTCNPKWRDILREIPEGHDPRNYPLITHRVFALKLKKMLDLLFKDGIFGRKIGSIYVIEFQKRGLPHAHILLILAPEDRPLTAAEVDDMISAELPDEATEPRYYKYVTSHMMHGPCGKENPAAPCMHDPRYPGRCSKGYPKKFCDNTKLDNEKGPEYRRRDNAAPSPRRVPRAWTRSSPTPTSSRTTATWATCSTATSTWSWCTACAPSSRCSSTCARAATAPRSPYTATPPVRAPLNVRVYIYVIFIGPFTYSYCPLFCRLFSGRAPTRQEGRTCVWGGMGGGGAITTCIRSERAAIIRTPLRIWIHIYILCKGPINYIYRTLLPTQHTPARQGGGVCGAHITTCMHSERGYIRCPLDNIFL